MALNQKYTWKDFLNENPEHKKNKLKRTSAEGKKAFEAAYKKFVKDYLGERQKQLEKMQARAETRRKEITQKVISFQKAKDSYKAKFYQLKAGRQDASIAKIKKQMEETKQLQKKI